MSFNALLADLETLQKARRPAAVGNDGDDALIRQAAAGDADQDGTPDGKDLPELDDPSGSDGSEGRKTNPVKAGAAGQNAVEKEEEEEEEEENEYFGKALTLTTPDGAALTAYDATALLKGVHQRLSALESDLLKTVQVQTDLIKSLSADLTALKEQGRGRKSVLNLHEKPGHYATTSSVEPRAVLAKALSAQKAGRLTGADVARIETYLGRGEAIPADLAPLLNGSV